MKCAINAKQIGFGLLVGGCWQASETSRHNSASAAWQGAKNQRPGTSDRLLKLRVAGEARKRNHIADVGHAGHKQHQALEAEAEATVGRGTKAAEVEENTSFLDKPTQPYLS